MKKTLIALSLFAALPAGVALADDDGCDVPRNQWQPREAAMQIATENGWAVKEFEIDDGCYEIEGRDSNGQEIEVKLDPATLQIVEMEYEDDDEYGGAANPAPAGASAPPQNGLFSNGTAPQVRMK